MRHITLQEQHPWSSTSSSPSKLRTHEYEHPRPSAIPHAKKHARSPNAHANTRSVQVNCNTHQTCRPHCTPLRIHTRLLSTSDRSERNSRDVVPFTHSRMYARRRRAHAFRTSAGAFLNLLRERCRWSLSSSAPFLSSSSSAQIYVTRLRTSKTGAK